MTKECPDTISTVIACLKDPSRNVRLAAREALPKVVFIVGKSVLAAVTGLLTHPYTNVRVAAVLALTGVAEKGDRNAIAAAIERIEDPKRTVQWAAVKTLSCIVIQGDQHTINSLIGRLTHHAPVRKAAIEALARVANMDDPHAIRAVCTHLKDVGQ